MIDILNTICNKIWKTGEWPTTWTQSLVITLPKNGNLQLCQNYRAISLISHPSTVLLKTILNRLKPQAEDIIAEEQAGFRAGRSTTEQIFNLRILGEKTCSFSRISTMCSQTSRTHLTGNGKKPYGQLCGNTTSSSYEPLKICMKRLRVQCCSTAAQVNGSELQ